jgi:hypothetical protein
VAGPRASTAATFAAWLVLAYRWVTSREGLLLAIYLHTIGAKTYSLQSEAVKMLMKWAPPSEKGGAYLPSDYARFFIYFVKDYLLPDWDLRVCTPKIGGNWPQFIRNVPFTNANLLVPDHPDVLNPEGNDADLWHIATAKEGNFDLITNEGFTPTGYRVGKISKKAQKEGVRTLFPKDVYAKKVDEDFTARAFLHRFRQEAPRYLGARRAEIGPDGGHKFLSFMDGHYQHILFGDMPGTARRAQVRI